MRKALMYTSMVLICFSLGCSGSINVIKTVEKSSKVGIVRFSDCDEATDPHGNCAGSGKKVSDAYSEVFGAPVIMKSDEAGFDVYITGTVTEYNEAVPMAFRPNLSAVDLKIIDKDGSIMATQKEEARQGNLFGSAKGCSESLAAKLKLYILK